MSGTGRSLPLIPENRSRKDAMTDIFILSAARTAIGGFGGSLSALPPIDIATVAAKAALERAGIAPDPVSYTHLTLPTSELV